MTAPILTLESVSVDRSGARVVRDFTATVGAGEVVAVLGSNGAGKSSLLRAVIGLEETSAGRMMLCGEDLAGKLPRERAAAGIGYCPEGRRLFPGLTVEENLAVVFDGSARARKARIEEMLDRFPALIAKRRDRAWSLSGGQQQMLAIARAIMNSPNLVLLDEPTLGLAPMIVEEVLESVRTIAANGAGVLLAEQNVGPALRVADRVLVIARGDIVYEERAENLSAEQIAGIMLTGDRSATTAASVTG
jgi:branched-chain amino acid transport system ATP-binding protein